MSQFHKISPEALGSDPFTKIGKDWMLISALKDGVVNTMTASWGGMGILWNKKVVFAFIRPQRYTKEFVDSNSTFNLTFFDEKYRDALRYFGVKSGRDEDKIANMNFHPIIDGDAAYFEEAKQVIVCRKLYAQYMQPECFLDKELMQKDYPNEDYHMVYVAEIIDVLQQDA